MCPYRSMARRTTQQQEAGQVCWHGWQCGPALHHLVPARGHPVFTRPRKSGVGCSLFPIQLRAGRCRRCGRASLSFLFARFTGSSPSVISVARTSLPTSATSSCLAAPPTLVTWWLGSAWRRPCCPLAQGTLAALSPRGSFGSHLSVDLTVAVASVLSQLVVHGPLRRGQRQTLAILRFGRRLSRWLLRSCAGLTPWSSQVWAITSVLSSRRRT